MDGDSGEEGNDELMCVRSDNIDKQGCRKGCKNLGF